MFVSDSQHLEIFPLPAVPTEHLDGHRQPHFLMSLHSVIVWKKKKHIPQILFLFSQLTHLAIKECKV